jgi:hypothetical protein
LGAGALFAEQSASAEAAGDKPFRIDVHKVNRCIRNGAVPPIENIRLRRELLAQSDCTVLAQTGCWGCGKSEQSIVKSATVILKTRGYAGIL